MAGAKRQTLREKQDMSRVNATTIAAPRYSILALSPERAVNAGAAYSQAPRLPRRRRVMMGLALFVS